MSTKKNPNILRRDSDEKCTHGWLVRVERKKQKRAKFFSDSIYGGKRKSLSAAINFRDEEIRAAEDGYTVWRRSVVRKNNTSGVSGVGRYTRDGGKYPFWCAHWDDPSGVRKMKRFPVGQYGEKNARKLAIEERKNQLLNQE